MNLAWTSNPVSGYCTDPDDVYYSNIAIRQYSFCCSYCTAVCSERPVQVVSGAATQSWRSDSLMIQVIAFVTILNSCKQCKDRSSSVRATKTNSKISIRLIVWRTHQQKIKKNESLPIASATRTPPMINAIRGCCQQPVLHCPQKTTRTASSSVKSTKGTTYSTSCFCPTSQSYKAFCLFSSIHTFSTHAVHVKSTPTSFLVSREFDTTAAFYALCLKWDYVAAVPKGGPRRSYMWFVVL